MSAADFSQQAHKNIFYTYAKKLTLPLILLLATLLRFYQLAGQSLWSDEGNSVALTHHPFLEIAQRTAFDIHPPFYYWLLKIWTSLFGSSEIALRSLSAVLGVATVYLVWYLASKLFTQRVGIMAAFMAALSPFLIYYAQEARMYMLLTFLGTLTVLLAILIIDTQTEAQIFSPRNIFLSLAYILTVTAGLYTHYAYPLMLLVANIYAFAQFWQPRVQHKKQIAYWLGLQIIPVLFYLPWLPTAWRQLTTWPSESITTSLHETIKTIVDTLLFGLSWPFETTWGSVIILGLMMVAIPILAYRLRFVRHVSLAALILLYSWLLLPMLLTLIIFSPAFLKFLLVAVPPLAILLALFVDLLMVWSNRAQKIFGYLMGGIILLTITATAAISLYHYYTNPAYARDNYRGIVNFIKAVGGADDVIILNAEGQQDVFNYYYRQAPLTDMPVHPLPRQRPLDENATLEELQTIARTANNIYAVYWATHQADPNGLIENWLNQNLYKATDQWYGNVRLVSYAAPQANIKNQLTPVEHPLGDVITLTGYGLAAKQFTSGDILQLALQWETATTLTENYTVFVQILDSANHVVGQRDAPPLTPSVNWPVNEPVIDAHGVFIEPGTPPGQHRLIVGLYNSQTGQRLPVNGNQDFIELTTIEIVPPTVPLPIEAYHIQTPLDLAVGNITLQGYDFYKLGHRSTPESPLHPGDPVHLVLYWKAGAAKQDIPQQITIEVVANNGTPTPLVFTFPLMGVNEWVDAWDNEAIIRAQHHFFLSNLEPGRYRLALTPDNDSQPIIFSQPFSVE